MQTMYYTTNNFIRHTGNVVDLSEYRRKLAQVQQQEEDAQWEAQPAGDCAVVQPRARRSDRRRRQALMLDACASMGIVVMTLTFTLHVLGL